MKINKDTILDKDVLAVCKRLAKSAHRKLRACQRLHHLCMRYGLNFDAIDLLAKNKAANGANYVEVIEYYCRRILAGDRFEGEYQQ